MSVLPMLSVAVSFLLTLFFLLYSWKKQKQYQFLPPGPAPLPLLGTPKYVGEEAACKYFPELCRKYGPVFTIWKLTEPMVVLCGYEVVKDALLNHAEVFSGRPFSPVIDLYSEGHSFPSIEGEKWRQLRRFAMATLRNFGMGKMSMEKLVVKESQHLVQAVAQTGGKQFNVVNVLGCAVGNIISYTLLGDHFDYQHPKLQKLVTTTRQFVANTHSPLHEFGNTFPIVLKMPYIRKRILKESSDLISFVKKYIEPHRQKLNPSSPRDFIDYYLLKIKEEEKISRSNFSETSLLMSLIALIGAGTETTSCTLNFILCVLANYPHVQAKVQQEVDEVIGSQRLPENVDRAQMPYTNAIIHELQRILDVAPIAHYHAVTEDIKFRGYTLPKGIAIVPFLTSVHFDPTQWETPDEFNPGHFLDDEGKFRLNPAFMPFSAGKRICAGENMARMELFLLLSALLQKFTFTLPPGQERQDCKKLKQMKLKSLYLYELCAVPRSTSSTA